LARCRVRRSSMGLAGSTARLLEHAVEQYRWLARSRGRKRWPHVRHAVTGLQTCLMLRLIPQSGQGCLAMLSPGIAEAPHREMRGFLTARIRCGCLQGVELPVR